MVCLSSRPFLGSWIMKLVGTHELNSLHSAFPSAKLACIQVLGLELHSSVVGHLGVVVESCLCYVALSRFGLN